MDKVPVYILAGGKSRRFGSDKARALLHGKPLILHVADALRPCATSITVVADAAGKYDDLGLPAVVDLEPHLGPLGGLHTALNHCPRHWLLLAPCDFPGISVTWVETLLNHRASDAETVAFRNEQWQPLPALYSRLLRPLVAALIKETDRALRTCLARAKSIGLNMPNDWPTRPGPNTIDDLRLLEQATRREPTDRPG